MIQIGTQCFTAGERTTKMGRFSKFQNFEISDFKNEKNHRSDWYECSKREHPGIRKWFIRKVWEGPR